MAAFLTAGTTAANSSSFTLTAGQAATLSLTPAATPIDAKVDVEVLLANGDWQYVGRMDALRRVQVVQATGTFRVRRYASLAAVGVDKD